MLTDDLRAIAGPVLREILAHPFWTGLRNGSLPGPALTRFVSQDTGHLLPALGRAFAGCAALSTVDSQTARLGLYAHATVASGPRLRGAFADLAPSLAVEPLTGPVPATAATFAYRSFLHAASTTSFAAGIGAVLPMTWFHMTVCENLAAASRPGSRYLPWIGAYHPGERAWAATREFLGMVDEIGELVPARARAELTECFTIGSRHEWAFADAAIQR